MVKITVDTLGGYYIAIYRGRFNTFWIKRRWKFTKTEALQLAREYGSGHIPLRIEKPW